MTAAVAFAWAALVLVAATRWRGDVPERVLALADGPVPATPARRAPRADVLATLGRLLWRNADDASARRVGTTVLAAAGAWAVAGVAVAVFAAAVAWAVPALAVRRRRERYRREVAAAVPDTIDLLVLAIDAGLTIPLALDAVARRSTGPIARAIRTALDDAARGRRLADALDDLPARAAAEVELRPLVAALVTSERYGAPLSETLARLADDARRNRRRRAEEEARRLPVKLLFPLVCCTLPAFGLLTVAPLVASALRALRL